MKVLQSTPMRFLHGWIPHLVPMELEEIQEAVERFRVYVVEHPELASR